MEDQTDQTDQTQIKTPHPDDAIDWAVKEVAEPTPVLPFKNPAAGSSLIDAFKEELKEFGANQTVLISVKGYEKIGLKVQYRKPEHGKEIDAIRSKVERQVKGAYERNLLTSIDTMIHLCDGLYVQPADVDEPVMFDPYETGVPAGFDDTLAELLGMNSNGATGPFDARAIIKKLFDDNDLAINSHSERLSRWLQNSKADVDAELWQLGE